MNRRPRQQIARQHTPPPPPPTRLACYARRERRRLRQSRFPVHACRQWTSFTMKSGDTDRRRHSKAATLAISHKCPTTQKKRVPLSINGNRMKAALKSHVKIRFESLFNQHVTNGQGRAAWLRSSIPNHSKALPARPVCTGSRHYVCVAPSGIDFSDARDCWRAPPRSWPHGPNLRRCAKSSSLRLWSSINVTVDN